MSDINTGGPAFPRSESLYPDGSVSDPGALGMTLRDWFAGRAMQGFISNIETRRTDAIDVPQLAKSAYNVADAMLKAREASNGS